ncbi:MAG: serine/threonine protein phosphatase [Helicobacter sp.]|nr:serine/threonine protein phosphatase [Helicobacter sp.]
MFQFDLRKPLYIIGDVHGCYETLYALIEKLPQKEESQIIFTGDVIDRGKDSCKVIELILQKDYSCVLGNHEELMMEYYHIIPSRGYTKAWFANGGYETIESYENYGGYQKIHEHLDWIAQLPRYFELNYPDLEGRRLFVTHGFGLPYYQERDKRTAEMTWNRLKMHNYEKEDKKPSSVFNVFGHDVQKQALIMENFAAIDTGCVYKDKFASASLTALEWPTKRIFNQAYCG